jgi:hypothetical protein
METKRHKWILANLGKLKNKRIACSCKPLACHGDIWAELADKV